MATTRLILQNDIYEILQKTSTAYGLYTPAKVQAMINDSLDYIASKMMKVTNGWLVKRAYANIVADDPEVTMPTDLAIINFVKIMSETGGTEYYPLNYSDNSEGTTTTESLPVGQNSNTFHFVDGKLYLEPTPSTAITNGILFEYIAYPAALSADNSELSTDMDLRPFVNYVKWRSASMIYSLGSEGAPSWSAYENQWYQASIELISRRFRQPTVIKSFNY